MLFGKPESADKWITEAVENERYTTQAESHGFIHVSTKRVAERGGGVTLTVTHESRPQGFVARLQSIVKGLLFKGVAKKLVLQDLHDIQAAVERGAPRAS